ncbi:hypothetical protein [Absidia glauca]|uniref:Uncharacterized protein n=1 Tax=Absidia glauca TaxID=4829 RepID=A0A163JL30_ABSGL|nr:hypothetical protein [Absidia glauca]
MSFSSGLLRFTGFLLHLFLFYFLLLSKLSSFTHFTYGTTTSINHRKDQSAVDSHNSQQRDPGKIERLLADKGDKRTRPRPGAPVGDVVPAASLTHDDIGLDTTQQIESTIVAPQARSFPSISGCLLNQRCEPRSLRRLASQLYIPSEIPWKQAKEEATRTDTGEPSAMSSLPSSSEDDEDLVRYDVQQGQQGRQQHQLEHLQTLDLSRHSKHRLIQLTLVEDHHLRRPQGRKENEDMAARRETAPNLEQRQ